MKSLPLAPIHLPPAPSWWPPAPGWWLLALLLILGLVALLWWWRRLKQRRRLDQWLSQQLAHIEQSDDWALRLHRLLRQLLCQCLPSLRQADEAGWQQSLSRLATDSDISALISLEEERYQPRQQADKTAALAQAEPLLRLALLKPRQARRLNAKGEADD